jgi:hypothetical protein
MMKPIVRTVKLLPRRGRRARGEKVFLSRTESRRLNGQASEKDFYPACLPLRLSLQEILARVVVDDVRENLSLGLVAREKDENLPAKLLSVPLTHRFRANRASLH